MWKVLKVGLAIALVSLAVTGLGRGSARADEDYELRGHIEKLPASAGWLGDWTVGGRTVRVDAATEIEADHGPVAVGAYVEVEGVPQSDGSVKAREIETKRSPTARQ